MKWSMFVALLMAAAVWAYTPTPVQKSAAEIGLKAALDKAETNEMKAFLATDFLNSKPTDIPAARMAQDAITRTLEDASAFFKARVGKSESVVDHYLYGRASGDSTIMVQEAQWILQKDPKNAWGHMLAGIAEWERAEPDYAKVEHCLQDAIAADPSRPESYLNLGYLYEEMEKGPESIAAFEAGAIADPTNAGIRDARLTYYATARQADKYFTLLEPTLSKEPLTGELPRANNGGGTVNAATALRKVTTVIEYWAYS